MKLNFEEVKHGTCAKFSEPVPKRMSTVIKKIRGDEHNINK